MYSGLVTFIIRCCLIGLILGQISVSQSQRLRNGRRFSTQSRHQVLSPRRPSGTRFPSLTQSVSVVRGARRAGSSHSIPNISTRGRQLLRLRQRNRSQRRPIHTNIPGPGLEAFLRDNQAMMLHRGNLRPPGGQRGAHVETPKIFTRNLQVLDGRRPQALRLSDQAAPRPRSPLRIRARLRTNAGPSPTNPSSTSSTKATVNSKPMTSPSTSTNSQPRQQSRIAGSDMISVASLLSLINGIRGQRGGVTARTNSPSGPSAVQTSPAKHVSTLRKAAVNPTPTTIFTTTSKKTPPTGQSFDPSLAMLSQLALMNRDPGEGNFLSSLFSSPLLLREFANGSGIKSIDPTPSSKLKKKNVQKTGKKEQKGADKKNEKKSNKLWNPLVNSQGVMNITRNMVRTGNPVQDKMINSLLEATIKNIQEEVRENMQKKMSEKESTTITSKNENVRIGK